MTTSKQFETAGGPWTNLAQVYCAQLDMASRSAEPMMRAMGRAQLEWTQFVMARARAWTALPARMSQCKSPVDMAGVQAEFWQTANRNYLEAAQRIWSATSDLAKRAETAGVEAANRQRDLLSVSEHEAGDKRQAA